MQVQRVRSLRRILRVLCVIFMGVVRNLRLQLAGPLKLALSIQCLGGRSPVVDAQQRGQCLQKLGFQRKASTNDKSASREP